MRTFLSKPKQPTTAADHANDGTSTMYREIILITVAIIVLLQIVEWHNRTTQLALAFATTIAAYWGRLREQWVFLTLFFIAALVSDEVSNRG